MATAYRKQCLAGIDPIEARNAAHHKTALETAKAVTFKQAAERYIDRHKAEWRNVKHAQQWRNTLTTYAYPEIGHLSVQAIERSLILKVLEPIWTKKPETASRVRGRIEKVLDDAQSRGERDGENPARWGGHLENSLPNRTKVRRVEHHAALAYAELGGFVKSLRKENGVAARALEFLIFTAARTGEVIGARWLEVDLAVALWTIPLERMKAGKEHRIPLSAPAMAILKELNRARPVGASDDAFVFPGGRPGQPLSNMALLAVLKRMERTDVTSHGFRSTFRDWSAERTNYPAEVAEMALAHTVGDKVEAAYRRGDLFDKRRRLMIDWARFCNTEKPGGAVVELRKRASSVEARP